MRKNNEAVYQIAYGGIALTIALFVGLISCGPSKAEFEKRLKTEDSDINGCNAKEIKHKGHIYLVFNFNHNSEWGVHSEACPHPSHKPKTETPQE